MADRVLWPTSAGTPPPVPLSSRDTLYDEWAAELYAALHDMDSRPLSRLVLGIRYAAGLLRTARRVANELGPARDFNHRTETNAADRLVVSSLDTPQQTSESS